MDPYKELASFLKNEMNRSAQQAIVGMTCVLGTMTASGVVLDDFKHEIKDPLVLEPLVDLEVENKWEVPAHSESGQINLPSIPTMGHSPTVAGDYNVTFKFDPWAFSNPGIKGTKVRVKYQTQYKTGDRVLCAVINSGQDVVIISRVVPYV